MLYNLSIFFGPERLAKAVGLAFGLNSLITSCLSGPIAAAILKIFSNGGSLAPWQWLFIIESLPCFIVATVVLILLPNSPLACGGFLSQEQHDWLLKYTSALQEEKKRISSDLAEQNISFWRVFRDSRVLLLAFTLFCWDVGLWGLTFWLPQLLRNAGDGTQRSMVTVSLLSVHDIFLTFVFAL